MEITHNSDYRSFINYKNKMNGLDLLNIIPNETIKIAFFDPQYRGVLDKLSYGNEGKSRGKSRSELPQMSEELIMEFINEIERVLQPNGYLFLWIDKFHLIEGTQSWFNHVNDKNKKIMSIVDMITWDKQKIGMGYRSRRRSEYLLVVQKLPRLAKSTWTLHNIPDVWQEKVNQKEHVHSKPIELQKQLLLATTNENDLILDPCAGSYSVFKCCQELNRHFIGSDLMFGNDNICNSL